MNTLCDSKVNPSSAVKTILPSETLIFPDVFNKISLLTIKSPPILTSFFIPTPPAISKAPVVIFTDSVVE